MSILCLIPARGGSQGIARKNLADVAGRPLLAWTVEQALAVPGLDVAVSTEDAEIADVARRYGARVIERPAELAGHTSATEPVVLHALDATAARTGEPEAVLLLQATSPVRLPGTLARALDEFAASGCDALVGVVPQAPFLWWTGDPPRADYDVAHRRRRQDLAPGELRYRETGSLYLTRVHVYREQRNRIGGRVALFVMDEVEGIDIDGPLDLELASRRLATLHPAPHPSAPHPSAPHPSAPEETP